MDTYRLSVARIAATPAMLAKNLHVSQSVSLTGMTQGAILHVEYSCSPIAPLQIVQQLVCVLMATIILLFSLVSFDTMRQIIGEFGRALNFLRCRQLKSLQATRLTSTRRHPETSPSPSLEVQSRCACSCPSCTSGKPSSFTGTFIYSVPWPLN